MAALSPRPSSDVLPAKVSLAWGARLLEVRHVTPGAAWVIDDLRVEATTQGTRVLAGDEVLLAAGQGETATRAFGPLQLTLEPPLAVDRVGSDARELDVRFFKITTIAVMIFFALVASFLLTPTDGLTEGDIFGGPVVKLTVAMPPDKTITKRPLDVFKKPQPTDAQPTLLQPKQPATRAEKAMTDRRRVSGLMAIMFGGGFGKVLSGDTQAIDSALNKMGPSNGALSAEGLSGMDARGPGPGGPPGNGLSIGSIGGPGGRPQGGPGFGFNPGKKRTFMPADGPRELIGNGLDKDVVMGVIRRHQSEIKFCYEKELQQKASLAGKIAVTWTIDATGSIADAQVAESGLNDANVEACILERIRRWRFPEPKGGGVVVITFPWVFHAAGADE